MIYKSLSALAIFSCGFTTPRPSFCLGERLPIYWTRINGIRFDTWVSPQLREIERKYGIHTDKIPDSPYLLPSIILRKYGLGCNMSNFAQTYVC